MRQHGWSNGQDHLNGTQISLVRLILSTEQLHCLFLIWGLNKMLRPAVHFLTAHPGLTPNRHPTTSSCNCFLLSLFILKGTKWEAEIMKFSVHVASNWWQHLSALSWEDCLTKRWYVHAKHFLYITCFVKRKEEQKGRKETQGEKSKENRNRKRNRNK